MNEDRRRVVVLAAGGTGGHIFPAQALAEVLLAQGYAVKLVTDRRFRDYHRIGQDSVFARMPIQYVHAGNLGGGLLRKLRGGFLILFGTLQARRILSKTRPVAVVGFGGYPSFPTMVAASSLRIPTIIHEQNAILGRANARLCQRVAMIATSYADTQKIPDSCRDKVRLTGNPVRGAIRALHHIPYAAPQEDGTLRLLVVGGSQGANIFSDVVPRAIELLPESLRRRVRIDQQCRPEDMEKTKAAYAALGLQADLAPFFQDMAARLAGASLVVGRAGASTVAELSCAGRPVILVPLPTAMDNHQYANAQAVEDEEAGWVMAQEGFTPQALSARLESFLTLPVSLQKAAQSMRSLGRVSAADDLAALVQDVAFGKVATPASVIESVSASRPVRQSTEDAA